MGKIEPDYLIDKVQIFRNISAGIFRIFQHHQGKFQGCGIMHPHPRIVILPFRDLLSPVPFIFRADGGSKAADLFRKTGSVLSPVTQSPHLSGFKKMIVKIKLGLHRVKIPTFQHRPIDKPLVLRRKFRS